MTILVVEDDAAVLAPVDRLLTQRGHSVLVAADPDDAAFVLAEHGAAPDLLLTDIVFAGRSGIDVAQSMKAADPSLKVVFMTAWPHRAPAAQRTGLGPVLRKPFSAQELYEIVEKA